MENQGRIWKLVQGPKWYFAIITSKFYRRFKKDSDTSRNLKVPLSKDI